MDLRKKYGHLNYLNLASSNDPKRLFPQGWLNIDVIAEPVEGDYNYYQCNISELPTEFDGQFEVIRASHVLEHFFMNDVQEVLKGWKRAMKPGGKIYISVPDILACAKMIVKGCDTKGRAAISALKPTPVITQFLGFHSEQNDQQINNIHMRHHMLLTDYALIELLEHVGFVNCKRIEKSEDPAFANNIKDDSQNSFSMCIVAKKLM